MSDRGTPEQPPGSSTSAPVPSPPVAPPISTGEQRIYTNGLATASLVLGILSVVFCWFYVFGFLMAVVAIVFGAVGISKADAGALNRGRAVAGLVLGIIGLLLFAVVVFFVLRAIGDNEGTEIGMVFLAIP